MDFPTHLKIGLLVGHWLEKTYQVSILSPAFLWGCIEPDYEHLVSGLSSPKKRHTFDQNHEEIAEKIQNLSAMKAFTNKHLFELGQAMHFLMDFHCYPHNAAHFDISIARHVLYEKQMGMTSLIYFNALFAEARNDVDPLFFAHNKPEATLKYLHTRYINESGKFRKFREQMILDVAFSSICCAAVAAGYLERCGYTPVPQPQTLSIPAHVYI